MAKMSFMRMTVGSRNGNLVSDANPGFMLNTKGSGGGYTNSRGVSVSSGGAPLTPAPKQKRSNNTKRKGSMRPKSGVTSQPTSGATTGNPQYDALLKLQQSQAGLTDLERLRQQLLSGDALNDASRLMQRGFISQVPKSFNTLG
jgi:hypothetical protein